MFIKCLIVKILEMLIIYTDLNKKIYSSNEIFHIKYLSKINDYLKLKNSSLICEIGPGYGCLVSKILKIYNCKIILIDLPESNFLSAYFLKSLFPEKNFF